MKMTPKNQTGQIKVYVNTKESCHVQDSNMKSLQLMKVLVSVPSSNTKFLSQKPLCAEGYWSQCHNQLQKCK